MFFGKCNLTHLIIDVMCSGQRLAILAMFQMELHLPAPYPSPYIVPPILIPSFSYDSYDSYDYGSLFLTPFSLYIVPCSLLPDPTPSLCFLLPVLVPALCFHYKLSCSRLPIFPQIFSLPVHLWFTWHFCTWSLPWPLLPLYILLILRLRELLKKKICFNLNFVNKGGRGVLMQTKKCETLFVNKLFLGVLVERGGGVDQIQTFWDFFFPKYGVN